jgi:DNA-binding transcriptional MerR regulator
MSTYTPAEASSHTGLSLDTLRYYEREGLIGPVGRTAGGRRAFTDDDLTWVGVVTCMRDAGLGIDDLRQFTALLRSDTDAADRVEFLRTRRRQLRERAKSIEAALGVLDEKIAHYSDSSKES